ncbi:dipicolinate synthase subunit B [Intestinibacillus massiliensis]|nr:dipicolinate synthase subunit B [Intestinibacillus massiliensis]
MKQPIRVGFALTGSFCTFARVLRVVDDLVQGGYDVTPILSENAGSLDTRFGTAASWREKLRGVCGHEIIDSIVAAEPIGPKAMFDVLVVAPCTGNTLAKLAHSIIDTPVTMAVKSHLRGARPVLLAVSTNDALSGSAANIGTLLNRKHYYFVPMGQDNPKGKPCSVVAHMERIPDAIEAALKGRQLEPLLAGAPEA